MNPILFFFLHRGILGVSQRGLSQHQRKITRAKTIKQSKNSNSNLNAFNSNLIIVEQAENQLKFNSPHSLPLYLTHVAGAG